MTLSNVNNLCAVSKQFPSVRSVRHFLSTDSLSSTGTVRYLTHADSAVDPSCQRATKAPLADFADEGCHDGDTHTSLTTSSMIIALHFVCVRSSISARSGLPRTHSSKASAALRRAARKLQQQQLGKRCVPLHTTRPSNSLLLLHLSLFLHALFYRLPRARLSIALGKRYVHRRTVHRVSDLPQTRVDLRRHSRFRRVSSFTHYNHLADRRHHSAKLR